MGEADAVVHSHLLEHLYEPRAFLRGLRDQARPEARMLLSVPEPGRRCWSSPAPTP